MPLVVGDRVKTLTGEEGELVVLNTDGISAYVRFDVDGKGAMITRLLLDSLTRIEGDGADR